MAEEKKVVGNKDEAQPQLKKKEGTKYKAQEQISLIPVDAVPPVIPRGIDDVTDRLLSRVAATLPPQADLTANLLQDSPYGFKLKWDMDTYEIVETIPRVQPIRFSLYWADFDQDPPNFIPIKDPAEECPDGYELRGSLFLLDPEHGEILLYFAPSAVNRFSSFREQWKKKGVDIFRSIITVGHVPAKNKAGKIFRVPSFKMVEAQKFDQQ